MSREYPNSIEAEQNILGSIFIDQSKISAVLDKIDSNDFYNERHQYIFEAIKVIYRKELHIDYTTVGDYLETTGCILKCGGIDYIIALSESVPSAANLDSYVDIVKDKSLIRKLIDVSSHIAEEARTVTDYSNFIDQAEKEFFEVTKMRRTTDFVPIKKALDDTFAIIETAMSNHDEITGLDTGFIDLNKLTLGLQKSDLIILAARPSVGKTALALNIGANVAKNIDNPHVVFFSLEMGYEQLTQRLLSMEAQIDGMDIRGGKSKSIDLAALHAARESISKLNISIDDSGTVKVTDLRNKCRKLKQEGKLDFVIIDYLQLLSGGNSSYQSRVTEVSEISRILKEMARELRIPVLALSQLSRGVESRADKTPNMADLRDSGSIEQDADIITFLYRDSYYDSNDTSNVAKIIMSKNRNGSTGEFELLYIKEKNLFKNASRKTY